MIYWNVIKLTSWTWWFHQLAHSSTLAAAHQFADRSIPSTALVSQNIDQNIPSSSTPCWAMMRQSSYRPSSCWMASQIHSPCSSSSRRSWSSAHRPLTKLLALAVVESPATTWKKFPRTACWWASRHSDGWETLALRWNSWWSFAWEFFTTFIHLRCFDTFLALSWYNTLLKLLNLTSIRTVRIISQSHAKSQQNVKICYSVK